LAAGYLRPEPGADTIRKTRAGVAEGWRQVASKLRSVGDHERADWIRTFLGAMPPPRTEKEILLEGAQGARNAGRDRDKERTR
jgi:hypothetical protein